MFLRLYTHRINLNLVTFVEPKGDDMIIHLAGASCVIRVPPGPDLDRLLDRLDQDATGPDLDRRLDELAGGET